MKSSFVIAATIAGALCVTSLAGCTSPLAKNSDSSILNAAQNRVKTAQLPARNSKTTPKKVMRTALDDYIARAEPLFAWKETATRNGITDLQMTSQQWQGKTWTHRVEIVRPEKLEFPDRALMIINGGNGSAEESQWVQLAANASGAWIVNLWNVPNQPLWDRREDDLIAYTFQKYIETGDETWPLLLPMVKSATQAMNAVEEWSKQTRGAANEDATQARRGTSGLRFVQDAPATRNSPSSIMRWTISGASKRGWTSWLVAAADRSPERNALGARRAHQSRVEAIIPMVYDNLNLSLQMPHQLETWGAYSPQIQDYTRRGLQAQLDTAAGQRLVEIVDPWSYRTRLDLPKLIVNATNDPYWTPDAANLYRTGLPGSTQFFYAPNSGHSLNGNELRVATVSAAWFRALSNGRTLPMLNLSPNQNQTVTVGDVYRVKGDKALLTLTINSPDVRLGSSPRLRLWTARSATRDFRQSPWESTPLKSTQLDNPISLPFAVKTDDAKFPYVAAYVEATWNEKPLPLVISSPVVIATR